jgi:hypothetical protein
MPISSGEIVYRLSGGAANTDPDAALGGAMSTAGGGVITTATLNNLFDDVSGDESASGDTEYRCFYVENTNGTLTLSAIKAWIATASASSDSEYAIGLDPAGVNGTATTIANESTAPAGVTFTRPTDKSGGLTIADLTAGSQAAIWVRRVISAAASAASSDGPTLRVEGDTPA